MLSRLLISVILLSADTTTTFAQQWEWVDDSNGSSNLAAIEDVAVDSVRDVICAAGYIDGNPNFSEILNADYSGRDDGVVMKYDLNGNVEWGFLIGGTGNDRVIVVAVDEINVLDIFIIQAVTPNNYGKNDFFELHSLDESTCDLKIFNRWGHIYYENSNCGNEWYGQDSNGDELQAGAYFCTIIINDSLSYEDFVALKR